MSGLRDFIHSPQGRILRPLHGAAMHAQARAARATDAFAYRKRHDDREWVAETSTLVIKTFERPAIALRLIRSARRYFTGRIVVADDSTTPITPPDPLVEVISLPFNSGVSVGRNAALARVETPYVIMSDDDAIFTRASDWEGAMGYLEQTDEVDLVAGRVIELPTMHVLGYPADPLFPGHRPFLRPPGEVINGLVVQAMTPQAWVGRAESIRRVGWDENLRMVDHRDFFSRAAGAIVAVSAPTLTVLHARTTFDAHYNAYRNDCAADFAYLASKWGAAGGPGASSDV